MLAWAGYVEDGTNDPEVDWITEFEQETGCKVNSKTFGTSDEAVQLMRTGQYDVVSASGDASLRLIAAGDVEPINTDLITNYKDIFEALKDKPWNSVEGQMYGIPHGRGANLLGYRTNKVKPAPDSWSAVFQRRIGAHRAHLPPHHPPDRQVAHPADIDGAADRLAAQMEPPGGERVAEGPPHRQRRRPRRRPAPPPSSAGCRSPPAPGTPWSAARR